MEVYDKQKRVRAAGTVQMKYEDLRTLDQIEVYEGQKVVWSAGTVQMKCEDLRILDQIEVYEGQKVVWSAGTVQMKRNDEIIEKKSFFWKKKLLRPGRGNIIVPRLIGLNIHGTRSEVNLGAVFIY